jgi:hypothetical protein
MFLSTVSSEEISIRFPSYRKEETAMGGNGRMQMKRREIGWILVLFSSCCGQPQDKIERIRVDGVDVVINHLVPYRTDGPSSLRLEEQFRLDTEDAEILRIGIPDILGFDVDPSGEIFILRSIAGGGDFIFKFDKDGNFVESFGRRGEGPGEIQRPRHIAVDGDDNILISDAGKALLSEYGPDGVFIGAEKWPKAGPFAAGPEGTLVFRETDMSFETGKPVYSASMKILDPGLSELAVVDKLKMEMKPTEFRIIEPSLYWASSRDEIFVASEERGYEISVFDPSGKLIRKIRKEFKPMQVSAADKEKILKPMRADMRALAFFPESHPPLQALLAAEDGTLLVETSEPGDRPGEYVFDIFNPEGVFVGRTSLGVFLWENHLWARIKGDRLYALREKPNGFKELVVSRMTWK